MHHGMDRPEEYKRGALKYCIGWSQAHFISCSPLFCASCACCPSGEDPQKDSYGWSGYQGNLHDKPVSSLDIDAEYAGVNSDPESVNDNAGDLFKKEKSIRNAKKCAVYTNPVDGSDGGIFDAVSPYKITKTEKKKEDHY